MDYLYFTALYLISSINALLIIYAVNRYHSVAIVEKEINLIKNNYRAILSEIYIIECKNHELEIKIKVLQSELSFCRQALGKEKDQKKYPRPYLVIN